MVFRNGERMLWNPLKRQALKLRPEERVRLQILEFLIHESRIPSSRISAESPVPSRFSRGRTDLLCYDKEFRPYLLIECKADSVRLSHRAATQSAVYNRFVKAPYLMLTNGLEDALYHVDKQLEAVGPSDYPAGLAAQKEPWHSDDPVYWQERGFLPEGLPPAPASQVSRRLALLFHLSDETRSWLGIPFPDQTAPLAHHHILLPASSYPDTLFAVTLCAVSAHEAAFIAVANRKRKNIGHFRCTIDANGTFHNPCQFLTENGDIGEDGMPVEHADHTGDAAHADDVSNADSTDDADTDNINDTNHAGDADGTAGANALSELSTFWLREDAEPVPEPGGSSMDRQPLTTDLSVRTTQQLAGILERILVTS